MNANEAARTILREREQPLPSRELARIALDEGLISSNSRTPVLSIAQTIDKNIRDDRCPDCKLVFMYEGRTRLVGLPSWEGESAAPAPSGIGQSAMPRAKSVTMEIRVPVSLRDKLALASQAGLANTMDDVIAILLQSGLAAHASQIRTGVLQQLDDL